MFPLKKNWSEQTLKPPERTLATTEQHLRVLPQGPLGFPGPTLTTTGQTNYILHIILEYQHLNFAIASQPAR